jgi:hypothetical protein
MQATAEQALRLAKDAEGKAEASGEKLVTVSNLATAAASQSELLELAQKVSKLQAEVPSSFEIGSVKSELDSLKGGMGALEGLSELEKGILNIGRRMDTLCDSVELSKGDILRAQTNIVHAQEQLSKNLEAVSSMGTQVDGLDRMRPLFEAVRGQVSTPPLSYMSCSRVLVLRISDATGMHTRCIHFTFLSYLHHVPLGVHQLHCTDSQTGKVLITHVVVLCE